MPTGVLWIAAIAAFAAIAALARPRRRIAHGCDRRADSNASQRAGTGALPTLGGSAARVSCAHQVQLARVLRFKRGQRDRVVWSRIGQLSLDFLIARPDTSIIAAVERDDSSHLRSDRQDADARKGHALKSAGVPLIRWLVGKMPDVAAIKSALSGLGVGRLEESCTGRLCARPELYPFADEFEEEAKTDGRSR